MLLHRGGGGRRILVTQRVPEDGSAAHKRQENQELQEMMVGIMPHREIPPKPLCESKELLNHCAV